MKYDIKKGTEIETVMDLTHTRETTLTHIEGFTQSPDGSKIMVWTDSRSIFRHSTDAVHYIYDTRTRILKPLSEDHPRQQSPIFSPDGRMVAFVAEGNIYVKKLDYWTEVAVTTDGAAGKIINGVPDWVYEEEFATDCSMAWSPDNLTLCYIKYDESQVPMFSFEMYEGSCPQIKEYALYPGQFSYKYPVAGQPNSKVSVHAYDIETRKTKNLPLEDSNIEYIPRIAFAPTSADKLMVATLNRDQTRMELYCINPRSTVASSILVEKWDAWISPDTYEEMHFADEWFVVFSCRSGYQHLYQYSYTGTLMRQLTSGQYDVDTYYGYNPADGCHYYRNDATGAINRTVSKVDAKGRVTDLTPKTGTGSIVWHTPSLSYYTTSYSNVHNAPTYTLQTSGKSIRVLEDNAKYQERWNDAPKAEFFTMQSDGYTLNGFIIKPSNFDASKRYPVIMSQYSGPGSQSVLDTWMLGCDNFFARQGYVVVCVDGRGTGGRGRAFSDIVYKNLGHYESIDQVAAAHYAAALPYVDPNRIAIYGWSYGGYESIMASSQTDAPYAAAVAVAPVTDWRYYDSIYTERYMLTPQQNASGYDASSTLNIIARRQCPLLIMTGTADDNVHMFNSVQYAGRAETIGRWCDMLLFPNMNHSINGCSNSRAVVYARMLNYLETHMR